MPSAGQSLGQQGCWRLNFERQQRDWGNEHDAGSKQTAAALLAAGESLRAAAAAGDDGHQADKHQNDGNDDDGNSDAADGVPCNLDAGERSIVAAMLELQTTRPASDSFPVMLSGMLNVNYTQHAGSDPGRFEMLSPAFMSVICFED